MLGDEGIRLMCWPHANRNIKDHLGQEVQEEMEEVQEVQEDSRVTCTFCHSKVHKKSF